MKGITYRGSMFSFWPEFLVCLIVVAAAFAACWWAFLHYGVLSLTLTVPATVLLCRLSPWIAMVILLPARRLRRRY